MEGKCYALTLGYYAFLLDFQLDFFHSINKPQAI
jgi:hypothetical protein